MKLFDWHALNPMLSALVQLTQLGENCKVEVPILVMYKVPDSAVSAVWWSGPGSLSSQSTSDIFFVEAEFIK